MSISDADSTLGVDALQIGAVDLVHKPTALATDRLYELSGELVAKVIAAAGAINRVVGPAPSASTVHVGAGTVRLIVIGTSTVRRR